MAKTADKKEVRHPINLGGGTALALPQTQAKREAKRAARRRRLGRKFG